MLRHVMLRHTSRQGEPRPHTGESWTEPELSQAKSKIIGATTPPVHPIVLLRPNHHNATQIIVASTERRTSAYMPQTTIIVDGENKFH